MSFEMLNSFQKKFKIENRILPKSVKKKKKKKKKKKTKKKCHLSQFFSKNRFFSWNYQKTCFLTCRDHFGWKKKISNFCEISFFRPPTLANDIFFWFSEFFQDRKFKHRFLFWFFCWKVLKIKGIMISAVSLCF